MITNFAQSYKENGLGLLPNPGIDSLGFHLGQARGSGNTQAQAATPGKVTSGPNFGQTGYGKHMASGLVARPAWRHKQTRGS